MSLELMKERIKSSGMTPRDEKIIDARRILVDDFENDTAYAKNVYYWNNGATPRNGNHLDIKFYGRKYSAANGTTKAFQTQVKDIIRNGTCIHDEYDDTYWLCKENVFNVDEIHYQGVFTQCNYLLTWQDNLGAVYKYWCKTIAASSSGVEGNATVQIGSDQLMVILPFDENTKRFKRDKRFMIMADGCTPICYKLTRLDTTTFMKNNIGCICLILSESSDYSLNNDNIELKICDYISSVLPPTQPTPDENSDKTAVFCKIAYKGRKIINAGGNAKILTAEFTDENGNDIPNIDFTWSVSIINEFSEFLHTEITSDKAFKIQLDFDNLLAGNYIRVLIYDLNGIELTSETFEIGGI